MSAYGRISRSTHHGNIDIVLMGSNRNKPTLSKDYHGNIDIVLMGSNKTEIRQK